jgi:hypothetical protein
VRFRRIWEGGLYTGLIHFTDRGKLRWRIGWIGVLFFLELHEFNGFVIVWAFFFLKCADIELWSNVHVSNFGGSAFLLVFRLLVGFIQLASLAKY